jgi:acyl-coenzyme A thioesterase PaaI-like protein
MDDHDVFYLKPPTAMIPARKANGSWPRVTDLQALDGILRTLGMDQASKVRQCQSSTTYELWKGTSLPGPTSDGPPDRDDRPATRDDVLPAGARHCFACGDANPIGMRLNDIRREGDQVLATLHPRPEFQSYPGVLHGGLSATALDEVMGYASILLAGIWAATATMDVRYRAQVPYDAPLPLIAGLTDTRGRRVRTWSRLLLPSGEVGAEATALLVALPEELASRARELYGPMA